MLLEVCTYIVLFVESALVCKQRDRCVKSFPGDIRTRTVRY